MTPAPQLAAVLAFAVLAAGSALAQDAAPSAAERPAAENPYRLQPFHADFPVELTWPQVRGTVYDKTRRQILAQLCSNLQGNVRKEAWHLATEFFWRAPDDAVEPLVEAMDRAFPNPALADVVKNCVEAMGRMANPRLEPALRRAAEHGNPKIHQAAFASLASCASPATLREMHGWFERMNGRARLAWLDAIRKRLDIDDCVPILRALMMAPLPIDVRDQVLRTAVELPHAQAAEVLRGRWAEAVGEFKAIIAGVLHGAGDPSGTSWLAEALRSEHPPTVLLAIRYGTYGDPALLRDDLLRLSADPRPDVRHELARALVRVEGDDVTDVYEILAAPDEQDRTRTIALAELTRRGRTGVVGAMMEELATATGTRLSILLSQIAASGDPRCVPELVARFTKAPAGEGRPFLQALSQNGSPAATEAMIGLFLGPDVVVARGAVGTLTTWNYVPTLLMNLRGREDQIFAAWDRIEPADWKRRALLLPTLSGIAIDRRAPELFERAGALLRAVLFDAEELPQLRVLALNLLTPHIVTVDDALRLQAAQRTETGGMKTLFADYLTDYF